MNIKRHNRWLRDIFSCLFLIVLCQACAKSSLITSWTADSFHGPVKEPVLVVGVFKNPVAQKIYENSFVELLGEQGVSAVPSFQYDLADQKSGEKKLKHAIAQSGAGAILITHLLGETINVKQLTPAENRQIFAATWDSHHGYHAYVYDRVWAEGERVEKRVDRFDTVIFDRKSGKAVWSARSKSVNFEDLLRKDDQELERLFVKDMLKHNVL